MSTLHVNQIESSQGGQIIIPSGYTLNVGGLQVNEGNLPPAPSSTGANGKALYTDGSNLLFSVSGPSNIVTFTTNGTYNKPANVSKIFVQVVGGGGAGVGYGESGGAGGYAEKLIDATGITSVQVTVGQGSTQYRTYSAQAGAGASSSFGSYLTATGGNGGSQSHYHCGGIGGVGSGGDFNMYGGGGSGHQYYGTGNGGQSYFGGGGPSGHPNGGYFAYNYRDYSAPGAGGACGYHYYSHGATGSNGIVVVYEYT